MKLLQCGFQRPSGELKNREIETTLGRQLGLDDKAPTVSSQLP